MISPKVESAVPTIPPSGWLMVALLLLVGGAAVLTAATAFWGYGAIAMLLLAFALMLVTHLFIKIAFREGIDLFEPVHWVFLYAFLGYIVAPLHMLSTGRVSYLIGSYSLEVQTHLMILALMYVVIGFIFFYIGYNTLLARRIGASLPSFGTTWSSRRARHIVFLFTIIGGVCFAAYIHYGGGILFLYSHPELRWFIFEAIPLGGYLMWGVRLLPMAVYIWFVDYLTERRSKVFWLYFLAVCTVMLAFGGRGRVLGIWLILLVLYYYLSKRLSIRLLIGVIIAAFGSLLVFSIWFNPQQPFEHLSYLLSGEYFGGLAPFMHIIKHVPSELGPYLGQSFLALFVFPIPRDIWPGKPTTAGRLVLMPFFPGQGGGVGVPLVAELYLNFLLPGVIIGMFLFGIMSRAFYAYLKRNLHSRATVLIYVAVLLQWIIGSSSADFVTTTVPVLEALIALYVALRYITRAGARSKRKERYQGYHSEQGLPGV